MVVTLIAAGIARADTVVTTGGDRLSGRIVAVGCDGLTLIWRDEQRIVVPLAAIAHAESDRPLPVAFVGGDRLTGTLVADGGTLALTSPVVGRVALRAADLAPGSDASAGSGRSSAAPGACPAPGGKGGARPADDRLAAARGRGPATGAAADPGWTAAAADAGTPMPIETPAADDGRAAVAETPPAAASGSTASTPPPPPGNAASPGASPGSAAAPGEDAKSDPAAAAQATAPAPESEAEPLQFLRTEAVLLPPLNVEGDLVLSYLRNNQSVQEDKAISITPTLRFGLIRGMEGFVQMPYSWGRREINTFSGVERNNVDGIGDVRFGLKYSVVEQSPSTPNVVLSVTASAPTGQNPYIKPLAGAEPTELTRDLRDPLSVPLGSGHWSVTSGFTLIKSFDPLILFGGANYTHFFPETYYGVKIEPGDLWDVTGGLGFAVNDTGTISGQLFAGYQEEWVFDGTHISESSGSPISLRLAYTHILSPHDLVEPSVIFGLTDDTNDALIALGYSHSF